MAPNFKAPRLPHQHPIQSDRRNPLTLEGDNLMTPWKSKNRLLPPRPLVRFNLYEVLTYAPPPLVPPCLECDRCECTLRYT